MPTPDFVQNYNLWLKQLLETHPEDEAMSIAVGGNFEATGILERCALMQSGLAKNHTLIDVGCGSGRLAFELKDYLKGRYIGIDVVPELLRYAREKCGRSDWKFYVGPGLTIPEPDQSADFVSFFSVFTHLLHAESYTYLRDALRVLRPGGKVVFSFVEFAVPEHWGVFEGSMADPNPNKVLLQFMSRDGIEAWANHLQVSSFEIHGGKEHYVELDKTVHWDNGMEWAPGKMPFGQSLCTFTK